MLKLFFGIPNIALMETLRFFRNKIEMFEPLFCDSFTTFGRRLRTFFRTFNTFLEYLYELSRKWVQIYARVLTKLISAYDLGG